MAQKKRKKQARKENYQFSTAVLASQQVLNLFPRQGLNDLCLFQKCKCYSLFFHISSYKIWSLWLNVGTPEVQQNFDFPHASSICGQQASKRLSCKPSTREKLTITFCSRSNFHSTPMTYSTKLAALPTSSSIKTEINCLVQALIKG